jgi:hypothetical protein
MVALNKETVFLLDDDSSILNHGPASRFRGLEGGSLQIHFVLATGCDALP